MLQLYIPPVTVHKTHLLHAQVSIEKARRNTVVWHCNTLYVVLRVAKTGVTMYFFSFIYNTTCCDVLQTE